MGKQLALTVAQTLRRHGYETMLVWVLADNPANGFYQALGGQRVAEKSITIGGAELTEIGYGWTDLAKIVDL